ncbi:MAG: hypothetical protein D5S03_00615 [Desulfonatronospira sp. MSAO_Bac3]|nr:MAG: hypothetical protein D5S03_00615 [Desulfonatronospira sp. MSAO_Bac3]
MDYLNPLSYNHSNRRRRGFYSREPLGSTSNPLFIPKYGPAGCDLFYRPDHYPATGDTRHRMEPNQV